MSKPSIASDVDGVREILDGYGLLFKKAGVYGMIGGQTADIQAESGENVTEELLLYIHENKTAALIEAAMMIGAILAGASSQDIFDIERAAKNVGIAFQIQDDILDVTSTTEELGKPVGPIVVLIACAAGFGMMVSAILKK